MGGGGTEEAILMQGRNQVLEVGREGSGKETRRGGEATGVRSKGAN